MASDKRKDEDLVRLTLSGSNEAFGILYDRYFSNVLRIARRIVSDRERARELTQESFLDLQEILEYGELRWIVFDAVNGLSAPMREPIRLFYYEQLTIREIAASMGISLSAVKVRLFRARLYLREVLYRLLVRYSFEEYVRGRGRRMLNASILDVVQSEEPDASIILLMDECKRVLPIYVGEAEGMAIALGVKKYPLPRPLAYDLVANLLEAIDAEITKVHVEALRNPHSTEWYLLKAGILKSRSTRDRVMRLPFPCVQGARFM